MSYSSSYLGPCKVLPVAMAEVMHTSAFQYCYMVLASDWLAKVSHMATHFLCSVILFRWEFIYLFNQFWARLLGRWLTCDKPDSFIYHVQLDEFWDITFACETISTIMIQILHYLPKVSPASFNVLPSLFVVGVGLFHAYEHISISKLQPCNTTLFSIGIRPYSRLLNLPCRSKSLCPLVSIFPLPPPHPDICHPTPHIHGSDFFGFTCKWYQMKFAFICLDSLI